MSSEGKFSFYPDPSKTDGESKDIWYVALGLLEKMTDNFHKFLVSWDVIAITIINQ